MDLIEIFEMWGTSGGRTLLTIIIILLSFIKIPKIEVNFWGWLGKMIKTSLTSDTIAAIAAMEKKIDSLETQVSSVKSDINTLGKQVSVNDIIARRVRILMFGDEIRHGCEHSKEYFDQILMDITHYKKYCSEHPDFPNEITVLTCQLIEDEYRVHWKGDDFA